MSHPIEFFSYAFLVCEFFRTACLGSHFAVAPVPFT